MRSYLTLKSIHTVFWGSDVKYVPIDFSCLARRNLLATLLTPFRILATDANHKVIRRQRGTFTSYVTPNKDR